VTLITIAIALFIASFFTSAILTAVVRKRSIKIGFVSTPSADRYNQNIIALGGGIAIFASLAAILIDAVIAVKIFLTTSLSRYFAESVTIHVAGFLEKLPQLVVILICMTILFAVGLYDDKKHLGPFFKLIVQLIVAFIAAFVADVRVEFFIESKIITSIISALWITFVINSFNFLDNMDGASAGMATIVSSILLTSAVLHGQVFISIMTLIFIAVLLGFLVFNFPPAKIFMGDAGSLVIGFFLATLTLKTTYYNQTQNANWYPILMPLIIMAVPFYDFMSVMILRISQGKSPFVGDTQHFSHRLKRRGLSDTKVVLTLYLATVCTGLGAVFLYQVNLIGAVLIFVQTFMILAIIAILESTAKQ